MFGKWLKSAAASQPPPAGAEELIAVVRAGLPDADEESVRVVAAIAGLLGVVAYADREYSVTEEKAVRAELGRVHGMTSAGVDAICDALRRHIVEISSVQAPRYSRELVELADRELKVEVLQVLVDLAAVDGEISLAEVNLLRQTSTALGLLQDDYNAAQARHRDKLSSLK